MDRNGPRRSSGIILERTQEAWVADVDVHAKIVVLKRKCDANLVHFAVVALGFYSEFFRWNPIVANAAGKCAV